jgi:predicted nucleotidyltransferase
VSPRAGILFAGRTFRITLFLDRRADSFGQMSMTQELARELDVSDRTLRRAVSSELLHGVRRSANKLEISDDERAYICSHWDLLQALVGVFRTEPGVEAAILFGSVAKGTDRADSDVDLAVELRSEARTFLPALERRVRRAVDRPVHIVLLEDALANGRFALEIIDHGRPLTDRGEVWASLRRRRSTLARKAAAQATAREREMATAWETLVRAA